MKSCGIKYRVVDTQVFFLSLSSLRRGFRCSKEFPFVWHKKKILTSDISFLFSLLSNKMRRTKKKKERNSFTYSFSIRLRKTNPFMKQLNTKNIFPFYSKQKIKSAISFFPLKGVFNAVQLKPNI